MIDFSLTEDQRLIVDMAKDFASNEILPKAAEYDESHTFPEDIIDKAQELGIVNLGISDEYGGGNMGPAESVLIAEILGHACAGIALAILTNNLASAPIDYFGTAEQKKKWLTLLCEERMLISFALTEPQTGSDLGGLKTHYETKNDGFVINGQKAWISNANRAGIYIVFAYPKGSQQISELSAFIVPGNLDGVIKARPEKKLGLKAADTSGLTFEDVFIPRENLLDKEGNGYQVAMRSLSRGRTGTAAIATGIQQRAIDECIDYSRTRYSAGKAIGDHPVIRQYIAQMQMATEASRLAAWRAAWKASLGQDYRYEASLAKAYATSTAEEVTLKAAQIMGGAGISLEYPIAKLVNDSKILSIIEGTTEIQKYMISEVLYSRGRQNYFTAD